MKVININYNYNRSYNAPKKNSYQSINNPIKKNNLPNIAFGGIPHTEFVKWDYEKLDILGRGPAGLKELAEYFHEYSIDSLGLVTTIKKHLFFKDEEASQAASQKLSNAINEVVAKKQEMVKRASELETKQARGTRNISKKEAEELEALKAEIKRLNDKSQSVHEEFGIFREWEEATPDEEWADRCDPRNYT